MPALQRGPGEPVSFAEAMEIEPGNDEIFIYCFSIRIISFVFAWIMKCFLIRFSELDSVRPKLAYLGSVR